MSDGDIKVGIISCSGEEIPEGTISRLATRRVLELMRPDNTVTICLPLFLAGNQAEQEFAKKHPTITVDGCDKLCAKKGTEKHSGPVSAALIVSDILNGDCACCARSAKDRTESDKAAIWTVSEEIAKAVDSIIAKDACCGSADADDGAACACSKPVPGIEIQVDGKPVTVAGLALIFDHLAENGLAADDSCGDKLLETVRIYHPIEPEEEDAYKAALISAYKTHRRI
ncbi:MAG: putative zinc-binding protein [Armatimonadota bacterium]|nr:putative zinc-binding protein [bacterium]